jgi:uncharacterized protein with FMN-binding domain
VQRTITTTLTVLALALPTAEAATAAAKPPKKKVVVTYQKFTGPTAQADRWGDLVVTISVRTTTTIRGTKKSVSKRMVEIYIPTYPDHTSRSIYISQRALPTLKAEALIAQDASIDVVSGATYTSDAFMQSLQAAIVQSGMA